MQVCGLQHRNSCESVKWLKIHTMDELRLNMDYTNTSRQANDDRVSHIMSARVHHLLREHQDFIIPLFTSVL